MKPEIITVPCLTDNYAYIIRNHEQNLTCLIDAPETKPIVSLLEKKKWKLDKIFLTHHHADHIEATGDLREMFNCLVSGAAEDSARLPKLDEKLRENDKFTLGDLNFSIMDVSGHTRGHIALYSSQLGAVFTADSLMTLGCGRLFEGTPKMMWYSLKKLCQLPSITSVFSGHDYTEKNSEFALSIDTKNTQLKKRTQFFEHIRSSGEPTVPSTIKDELETNIFLRSGNIEIKEALDMIDCSDETVFTELRRRRDNF